MLYSIFILQAHSTEKYRAKLRYPNTYALGIFSKRFQTKLPVRTKTNFRETHYFISFD